MQLKRLNQWVNPVCKFQTQQLTRHRLLPSGPHLQPRHMSGSPCSMAPLQWGGKLVSQAWPKRSTSSSTLMGRKTNSSKTSKRPSCRSVSRPMRPGGFWLPLL